MMDTELDYRTKIIYNEIWGWSSVGKKKGKVEDAKEVTTAQLYA